MSLDAEASLNGDFAKLQECSASCSIVVRKFDGYLWDNHLKPDA